MNKKKGNGFKLWIRNSSKISGLYVSMIPNELGLVKIWGQVSTVLLDSE